MRVLRLATTAVGLAAILLLAGACRDSFLAWQHGGRLIAAVRAGNEDRVCDVLASGVVQDAKDTALELAICKHGRSYTRIASILLDAHASANTSWRPEATLLSRAIEDADEERVSLLLAHGANPHNDDARAPLALAAFMGKPAIVELLLRAGAEVNAQTRWRGTTALMSAVARGNVPAMHLLIRHGANLSLRDDDGRSALDFALERRHKNAIQLLRSVDAPLNDAGSARPNFRALMMWHFVTEP